MVEVQPVLNWQAKVDLLRAYATRYPRRVMVETGLWNGRGSGFLLRDLFDRYYAIDIDQQNVTAAWSQGAFAFCGDSAKLLPRVLRQIGSPAFFWLDAHYIGQEGEPDYSPLLAELDAILNWRHAVASVVLIDDVRLMTGAIGWPTLEEVKARCFDAWEWENRDDILRLTPW